MKPEPPHLFADTVAPVLRSTPNEIFLICMEAVPEPDSEDCGSFGGAYVNCYIDADDLRTAELRAIGLIKEGGWNPTRFDSWEIISSDGVDGTPTERGGSSPRECVEQALLDGEVCIFHCWPVDSSDADNPNA